MKLLGGLLFQLLVDKKIFRYYNSNWATYDDDYKEFLRLFFLAQIDGFEAGGTSMYILSNCQTSHFSCHYEH